METEPRSAETSEPRTPYEPPAIEVLGPVAELTGGLAFSATG